jgi:hypothetical protein
LVRSAPTPIETNFSILFGNFNTGRNLSGNFIRSFRFAANNFRNSVGNSYCGSCCARCCGSLYYFPNVEVTVEVAREVPTVEVPTVEVAIDAVEEVPMQINIS